MLSLLRRLAALLAVATLAHTRPFSQTGFVIHEKRETPIRAWVRREAVAPNALLPMKIGLKQQNLHMGYDYLMDV